MTISASAAATAATSDSSNPKQHEATVAVCCGSCRPSRRRLKRQQLHQARQAPSTLAQQIPQAPSNEKDGGDDADRESEDSQYFFDAVQEPLGEDEYPVVFYSHIKPKPREFDLEDPTTLLSDKDSFDKNEDSQGNLPGAVGLESHQSTSQRLSKILRRTTLDHKAALEAPRIKIGGSGYPGELSVDEVAECVSILCSPKGGVSVATLLTHAYRIIAMSDDYVNFCS